MSLTPHTERFVPPKELPDQLAALGADGFNHKASRHLIAAMRKTGGVEIVRNKYVRPTDALAWMIAHPDWAPYGSAGEADTTVDDAI